MTNLERLHRKIEPLLIEIEKLLPIQYRLTLVARNIDASDGESDVIMSRDDLDAVAVAIVKLKDREPAPHSPREPVNFHRRKVN